MGPTPFVETFRWKGKTRRLLGANVPLRDAEGSTRAVVEGGWLAVAYPKDRTRAYVETIERAEVTRSFSVIRGSGRNENEESVIVSRLRIESSVGSVEWSADADSHLHPADGPRVHTFPFLVGRPGVLNLPNGQRYATDPGSGFFDAKGLVHAFEPWRDADIAEGWTAITEVSLSASDELRPLLAALPLLLFTSPPGLFD